MPVRKTEHQDKHGNWEIAYTKEHGCNDMLRLTYRDHTASSTRSLPTLITDCTPLQLRILSRLLNSMAEEVDPSAKYDEVEDDGKGIR